MMQNVNKDIRIAIVGLGYIGLPLAIEFSKQYKTIGYDISEEKIAYAATIAKENDAGLFECTNEEQKLIGANVYIVAVPTPISQDRQPDLSSLISATRTVSRYIKKNDIVIFESTVYPGTTEMCCVPILEESGLTLHNDFEVGYSPERVSPATHMHDVSTIVKVVSASSSTALKFIEELYTSIIKAGVHTASSIRVAEAAKLLENVQRDVGIALINEYALLMREMHISIREVIAVASTKWNFTPYYPGVVGGHCIAVDPYYYISIANKYGSPCTVSIASRQANENMISIMTAKCIELVLNQSISCKRSPKVLVLGASFKCNCEDIRNSGSLKIAYSLATCGFEVVVFDPIANGVELRKYCKKAEISVVTELDEIPKVDGVVCAVWHDFFTVIADRLTNMCFNGRTICVEMGNELVNRVNWLAYWSLEA